MIRSLLLAAGFLVVTIALLFLQPAPNTGFDTSDLTAAPVTRAEVTPNTSLPQAVAPAPPVRAEVAPEPAPAPRQSPPRREPDANVVENFLSPGQDDIQQQLALMTRSVVEELRAPVPQAPPPPPGASVPAPAIDQIATRAAPSPQNTALSDEDMVAALRNAVASGELAVDPAYMTAAGDVDFTALLVALMPERGSPPATVISQDFLYRIQPSDSLAGLAALFYGDANLHNRILAANAQVLRSANDLSPGMLLQIPGA